MYRIFIVEDDPVIVSALCAHMEKWGFECRGVEDFRKVTEEFAAYAPHLVLMDISLPFYDGYHWCAEIRKLSKTPMIFLSSAAENMNILMALSAGADDFVQKPFDLSVLLAKVQALLRRTYDFGQAAPTLLSHEGLLYNPADGTVEFQGKTVPLSKNESRILGVLLRHKGETVSRENLMNALWETDCFVDENTLTVNVTRLRRRLESIGAPETVVEQVKVSRYPGFWQVCKIVFVCCICFFGAAFTIMAFHNDIGIREVFGQIYELLTGQEPQSVTALEIAYSIGLALGILVFFNHIGGRRITSDPTPIEVEMRKYETDVNQALTETADREKKTLDV